MPELRVRAVTPLEGRSVRLTLSDGSDVERDLTDLLDGPVFVRIAAEDAVLRRVRAIDGMNRCLRGGCPGVGRVRCP
jgi:Protein of unknown function (DUF2442).